MAALDEDGVGPAVHAEVARLLGGGELHRRLGDRAAAARVCGGLGESVGRCREVAAEICCGCGIGRLRSCLVGHADCEGAGLWSDACYLISFGRFVATDVRQCGRPLESLGRRQHRDLQARC